MMRRLGSGKGRYICHPASSQPHETSNSCGPILAYPATCSDTGPTVVSSNQAVSRYELLETQELQCQVTFILPERPSCPLSSQGMIFLRICCNARSRERSEWAAMNASAVYPLAGRPTCCQWTPNVFEQSVRAHGFPGKEESVHEWAAT